jgi:hypothetical protein
MIAPYGAARHGCRALQTMVETAGECLQRYVAMLFDGQHGGVFCFDLVSLYIGNP